MITLRSIRRLRAERAARALAAAALAATMLALAGQGAAAQSARQRAEEVGLSAELGFGGRTTGAGWGPLEVSIQPARLVAGTLSVRTTTEGGGYVEEQQVEVAAGSRKVFRFVVPSGAVTVRLHEPGLQQAATVNRASRPRLEFLVGALGGGTGTEPPLQHDPTGLVGAWVDVDPAWVELSPLALGPLGGLVAQLGALEALTTTGRRNVAAAVAGGLDLVVVADRDGPLDLQALGLPWNPAVAASSKGGLRALEPASPAWTLRAEDLQPGAGQGVVAATVPAGAGRVSVVGVGTHSGPLADALWSRVVGPSPRANAPPQPAVEREPWQFGRLFQEAVGRLPALPWLSAFLLVYVVVVGPFNALVLRRVRRRELAWVTVPVVTAVFTTAAFLGAVGDRAPEGLAGRVRYWVDGVGAEALLVGVRASTPEEHRVLLDGEGWTVRPVMPHGEQASVTRGEPVEVTMNLAAFQLGGVVARRTVADSAPLELGTEVTEKGLAVTVANTGTGAIDDVVVHAGTVSRRVGRVGAGRSETVTLPGDRLPPRAGREAHFEHHLPPFPSLPRSAEALLDVRDGSPGLVWAVGIAAGPVTGVRVGGKQPLDRGEVVAVATRPSTGPGGAIPLLAVERALIAPGGDVWRPSPWMVETGGVVFLRFRFPPGAQPAGLRSQLDRGQAPGPNIELAVWDHPRRRWVPHEQAFAGGTGDPATLLSPLGELYARASGELFPFEFSVRTVQGVGSDE